MTLEKLDNVILFSEIPQDLAKVIRADMITFKRGFFPMNLGKGVFFRVEGQIPTSSSIHGMFRARPSHLNSSVVLSTLNIPHVNTMNVNSHITLWTPSFMTMSPLHVSGSGKYRTVK